MKKPILSLLAVALFAFGTAVSHAQTTDYTLGTKYCGNYNPSQAYCYGVPIGTTASLWMDYRTTTPYPAGYPLAGYFGFVQFYGSLANLGEAYVTELLPDGGVAFSGIDSTTKQTYYGLLNYTFSTYWGGYGRSYGKRWIVTGGTVSIQKP